MSASLGAPVGKGSWAKIVARQLGATSTTLNSHPARVAAKVGTVQAKGASWEKRMTPTGAKKGTASHTLFDSGRVH